VITDKENHIYMMPGLAASSLVFENINLKNSKYQLHRLDWIQPKKNESIKSYCLRLSKKIKHKQLTETMKEKKYSQYNKVLVIYGQNQ